MIQEPFERHRIHRFARREDDRELPVPLGVHIRTVGDEQLHHRDAIAVERRSHQRPIAALVHVRAVFDHPLGHRQPRRTGRLPRHPAFGHPRERTVLSIAKRRAVKGRVARHHRLDALEVVAVDRLFELPDLLQRLDDAP